MHLLTAPQRSNRQQRGHTAAGGRRFTGSAPAHLTRASDPGVVRAIQRQQLRQFLVDEVSTAVTTTKPGDLTTSRPPRNKLIKDEGTEGGPCQLDLRLLVSEPGSGLAAGEEPDQRQGHPDGEVAEGNGGREGAPEQACDGAGGEVAQRLHGRMEPERAATQIRGREGSDGAVLGGLDAARSPGPRQKKAEPRARTLWPPVARLA